MPRARVLAATQLDRRAGLPVRLLAALLALAAGLALGGCSMGRWAARDDGGERPAASGRPCTLLRGAELGSLGRARLGESFTVGDPHEAADPSGQGAPGCQYPLRVPADPADRGGAETADAGLELYTYRQDTEAKLRFYASLASDAERFTGVGEYASWSARQHRLLLLRDGTLVLAEFQLPSGYQGRDRALALDVARVLARRL